MQLREYAGAADTTAMQRLASRLWPRGLHPGGLGWSAAIGQPTERAARVEVHQRAWQPSLLPWHPDHRPVLDPGSTSRFGPAEYAEVGRTWLYDPEFDLVVVAPDGSFAACCIAWLDPDSGCAEIEPLGVVAEHRNRGLAGFLCLEVAARVGKAGGRDVFINTGPSAAYPAPAGAYRKAGFTPFSRGMAYQLTRKTAD